MPIQEYDDLIKRAQDCEDNSDPLRVHDKEVEYINSLCVDILKGVVSLEEAPDFYFFRTDAGRFILRNFDKFKEMVKL